ncbi:MAG: DNA ligase D, partial [Pseudomonadota bacterium]
DHVERVGEALFEQAVAMQLEGIVGKRMESPYRSGRSDDWLKIPALATAEFAVIGYAPERSGAGLGSLRLASLHEGRWVGVGRVAASLDEETRSALLERLESLVDDPVLDADQSDLVSVRPELVVEVRFKAWTENGHLRQPVLLHVRDDREPTSCRSGPWSNDAVDPVTVAPAPSPERVLVTNRDKVFWPECATTKGQLVDYYRAIAPRMLPYLRDRPVVLTRYPDGIDGKSFYQHRAPDFLPDWIRREAIWNEGDAEEREYIIIEDADTLAYVANLGAIPIHLWSARAGNLQRPDWCVLDLDPKEAPFRDVVTVARCLRDVLEEAQIAGFLKTTGSSGLHVLVPLAGTLTHDQARDLGELLARICVHRLPGLATIQRRVELREGRVYVDFLQNGHGKTIAAPYSVRPLPGAPLSLPLRWSDLKARLSPRRYHMGNIARRLAAVPEDPMAPLLDATFDPAAALGALAALG